MTVIEQLVSVVGLQTVGQKKAGEKSALVERGLWDSSRDALRRSCLSFAEIAEIRRKRMPILAEYDLNWGKVAIGLSAKRLATLQNTIHSLAQEMSSHSLGVLLLVEKNNYLAKSLGAEVIELGLSPPSWLRDCYFPSAKGLVELAASRRDFWPNVSEFLLNRDGLRTEIIPSLPIRRGDIIVGDGHVFVGGNTWSYFIGALGDPSKAKSFLEVFFNGRKPIILPGEKWDSKDIPDWLADLDFYFTLVGDKQAMVAQAVCPSKTPKCDFLFEDVAQKMASLGYEVARLPCDPRANRTYNNCLIQGPKKLAFVPQYGQKDELWPMVEESFRKFGFASHPVPFLASFVKDNFGALCCLTLPLPNSSS